MNLPLWDIRKTFSKYGQDEEGIMNIAREMLKMEAEELDIDWDED